MVLRNTLTAFLILLAAAGCSSDETGPAGATAEAVEAPSFAGFVSDDCQGVPYLDDHAVRTAMTNWRLRYGTLCPTIPEAVDRCDRLIGTPEKEKFNCVTENVAMAPASCPDAARNAFLDAFDLLQLVTYCRAAADAALDRALAAHAGDLAPRVSDRIVDRCQFAATPDAVALCVRAAAERHAESSAAVDEALALYDTLPPGTRTSIVDRCLSGSESAESAARCATEAADAEAARAERLRTTAQAARNAVLERLPPEHAEDVTEACAARASGPEEAADCGARLGDARRALLDVLAPVAAADRAAVVDGCLAEEAVVDGPLRLPDPGCVADDVAAYATIRDGASGYDAADVESCHRKWGRWSGAHNCIRFAWLTRERIAAVKAEALPGAAAAGIEWDHVRPTVIEYCDREAGGRASDMVIGVELPPGMHAADAVRRRVRACVDDQAAGFGDVARLAAMARTDAFDDCTRDLHLWVGRHDWRKAATCIADRAEDDGDAAFVELLRGCTTRYWGLSVATLDEIAACGAPSP